MGALVPNTRLAFQSIDHICEIAGWEHVAIDSNYMVNPADF
jgi:microsomal dipeptidase-like Zn-dependent dipeptidase